MGSPFAGLSVEIPSAIVDRVYDTLLDDASPPRVGADADFLAFFKDKGGTAGGNIKILLRPDPKFEPATDPYPGLLLWGLSQNRALQIGSGDFVFSVGFRMVYPAPPRFRATGEADAGDLVWKFFRPLWNNQALGDALKQNPKADKIVDFSVVRFEGLVYEGAGCVDIIEGSVSYEKNIDKEDI